MKCIVRYPMTGTRNGEPWPARGEEIDLTQAEAAEYLNAGYVVPAPPQKVRTAAAADPAKAASPAPEGAKRAPVKTTRAKGKVAQNPPAPPTPEPVPPAAETVVDGEPAGDDGEAVGGEGTE